MSELSCVLFFRLFEWASYKWMIGISDLRFGCGKFLPRLEWYDVSWIVWLRHLVKQLCGFVRVDKVCMLFFTERLNTDPCWSMTFLNNFLSLGIWDKVKLWEKMLKDESCFVVILALALFPAIILAKHVWQCLWRTIWNIPSDTTINAWANAGRYLLSKHVVKMDIYILGVSNAFRRFGSSIRAFTK